MKDAAGNVLEVGDEVYVAPKNYRGLVKAKVIAFTPQQVRLEYINNWNFQAVRQVTEQYLVYPSMCVKAKETV